MAEDIAPALLEKVPERFRRLMAADPELQEKLAAVRKGSTSYTDALDYADRVGQALKQALQSELTADALPDGTLYYNIAKRLVEQVSGEAYDLGEDAATQVQKAVNTAAGLQLNAVTDKAKRADRLAGLVESAAGKVVGEVGWADFLKGSAELPMGAVSDTMEANASFQSGAGLHPKIIRKASAKCCAWCRALNGEYSYPVTNRDIYRRHENCRCTVEYDPNTGIRQNVHTKQWTDDAAPDKIEARKKIGLSSAVAPDNTISKAISDGIVKDAINREAQARHSIDSGGYVAGRSGLYGDINDAERLYDKLKTTGAPVLDKNGNWTHKERVKDDKPVGLCLNTETMAAMIVYSKTGSHIYPRLEE